MEETKEVKVGVINKVFQDRKFGFIETPDGKEVHFAFYRNSHINEEDFIKGVQVSFQLRKTDRGITAIKINFLKSNNSANIPNYPIPVDTRQILRNYLANQQTDNFFLQLNKYSYFDEKDNKFILYRKGDKKKKHFELKPNFALNFVKRIAGKHKEAINRLGYIVNKSPMRFPPNWRLIIGLGSESVYETSMTLHFIYGIPYIPGQAIKGVVRNFIINEIYNGEEGNKNIGALSDKDFCKIFGSPKDSVLGEQVGSVIFFDAFPIDVPTLKPDIMNVHYPDYYGKKNIPPADYQNPNPIYFLTVGEDEYGKTARFEFFIGVKQKSYSEIDGKLSKNLEKKDILSVVSYWLKVALEKHGIGAKTAVNYGYFNNESKGEDKNE